MRKARLLVLLLLVLSLAVTTGCSRRKYDSVKVIDFIDDTTPHAYRFDYQVVEGGREVGVQGIIEDDFRYKLQLSLDDDPAAEQVVVDDALALRFLDPDLVEAFTDPAVEGQIKTETDIEGATVFDALTARRWVLDEAGAPSAIITTLDESDDVDAPNDPLFDARTALAYVRRVADTTFMTKYDPESLDPTYRRDEDPFPVPADGSGVTRYDSVIFDLPAPAAATSGDRELPTAANFRKMAVYVKGGVVIAVREFIGATPRQLEDLQEYEEALLDATAGPDVVRAFRQQIDKIGADEEELTTFLLGGLNTFITSTGADPIRFRTMSLEITDLDEVDSAVALPNDVVHGDLAVMRNMGRKPLVEETTAGADL